MYITLRLFVCFYCLYVGSIVSPVSSLSSSQCSQINSCACVFDDGSMVDLSPLRRSDGQPQFSNVTDSSEKHFVSWNPCTPFSILPKDSVCADVAMCMITENKGSRQFYDLGRQDSATLHVDVNGTLKLQYTSIGDIKRISDIELRCLPTSRFDFFVLVNIVDEGDTTRRYIMILASKYACPYRPFISTSRTVQTTRVPSPAGQCTKINSCSCKYDDETTIDLSPLARADGKPYPSRPWDISLGEFPKTPDRRRLKRNRCRYKEIRVPDPSSFTNRPHGSFTCPIFSNVTNQDNTEYYTWNPCTPFSYINTGTVPECQNVAVCMILKGIPNEMSYDLGKQDTAQFMTDSKGTLKLTYTSNQGIYKRVAEITLQCMTGSKFDFFVAEGEKIESNNTIIYQLLLASKYACAYRPSFPDTSTSDGYDTSEPIYPTSNSPERSSIISTEHTYIATTSFPKDDSTPQTFSMITIINDDQRSSLDDCERKAYVFSINSFFDLDIYLEESYPISCLT